MNTRMHAAAGRAAIRLAAVLLLAAAVSGCASLTEVVQRPTARVTGARITGLTFDRAEITFDVEVENPNPVGVRLAGIDYELFFGELSFLRGQTDEPLDIAANGASTVRIPVSVGYTELIDSVRGIAERTETDYRLAAGVSVDIPVIGRQRLPIEHTGSIPVVRAPRIRVRELRIDRLGLTGADVILRLGVANPNGFGLSLEELDYALRVNGELWGSARVEERARLAEGGETEVRIPISLDFGAMGRSVRELILGDGRVAYNLSGRMDVGTTLEMLGQAELPLSLDGEIGLSR